MNPLLIILQTYQRTEYALITIKATLEKLRYPGEVKWYVADDGSGSEHLAAVREAIGPGIVGEHSRHWGYGGSANRALAFARDYTDLTLWLEDDWQLTVVLDLSPYLEILRSDESVGMIRLGRIPKDLDCTTEERGWKTYLNILNTRQYMFSGNPSLRHKRFHDCYGGYPEGLWPGDTELAFDGRIRQHQGGVKILADVDLGTWGAFAHIGRDKSF